MKDYGYCNKFKIPPSTLEILLGHLEIGYARYFLSLEIWRGMKT